MGTRNYGFPIRGRANRENNRMIIRSDFWVALALLAAIVVITITLFGRPARSDGLPIPPPLIALPYQQPPTRSCVETAIQLGYQTGNRYVANAGVAACRYYAPVVWPRRPWAAPLGGPAYAAMPAPPAPPQSAPPPNALNGIQGNNRGVTRQEVEAALADWCEANPDAGLCKKLERRQ
jgi:hypothetical protein